MMGKSRDKSRDRRATDKVGGPLTRWRIDRYQPCVLEGVLLSTILTTDGVPRGSWGNKPSETPCMPPNDRRSPMTSPVTSATLGILLRVPRDAPEGGSGEPTQP